MWQELAVELLVDMAVILGPLTLCQMGYLWYRAREQRKLVEGVKRAMYPSLEEQEE